MVHVLLLFEKLNTFMSYSLLFNNTIVSHSTHSVIFRNSMCQTKLVPGVEKSEDSFALPACFHDLGVAKPSTPQSIRQQLAREITKDQEDPADHSDVARGPAVGQRPRFHRHDRDRQGREGESREFSQLESLLDLEKNWCYCEHIFFFF